MRRSPEPDRAVVEPASIVLEIKSTEAHVYEALRAEIVRGLEPGSPLRLSEIAARYGVSTMPVRAALRRLELDGLVRGSSRRGHVVAPLDARDLGEIQAVRAAVEGYAARLGAERLTDDAIRRMAAHLQRLRRAALGQARADRYLAAEHAFRDVCYDAAGQARLLELVATYRRAADRYIHRAFKSAGGIERSLAHQQAFLAACARRDGEGAEEATRDALAWTVAAIGPLLGSVAGAE